MTSTWKLYVNGFFNIDGNEARIILISLEEQKFEYEVCFDISAMNNISEYEVFLLVLQKL